MSGYRLKGKKVIINGQVQQIIPGPLPSSPEDGFIAVDEADMKLKIWHDTKSRWLTLGDAEDVVFDNSSNGFVSENVQDAIEESKSSSVSSGRFVITTFFNGTIGNNNWLGFNDSLPGDRVPIRIPVKCKLKEIQFSYNQNNLLGIPLGSENIDGRFDLYKNGLSSPGDVVFQGSFVNQPAGKYFTGVDVSFDPGDFMVGRWVDQGDNPSDMAVLYFFEVLL